MAENLRLSRSAGFPRRKFSIALAAGWWFLQAGLPLAAQEQGEVNLRIDFVAWGNDIGGISLDPKKEEGKITARAFRYSEPVKYSGPRVLQLHQTGGAPSGLEPLPMTEEDKEHESVPLPAEEIRRTDSRLSPVSDRLSKMREEQPTLVALIPLPAGARRVTVLLAPAAEGTYEGYVINDDPAKLPAGKLRVHNLSPHPIMMTFNGKKEAPMKPRGKTMVNVAGGQMIYQLAYQKEGEWTVQENNIIPVLPTEQTQLIVLKSNNSFFQSSDGATGGFLQMVTLTRSLE